MLNDVAGKPILAWDSRDHQLRSAYDQLRRPTDTFLLSGGEPELLVGRTVYGEVRPNPESNNLRGRAVEVLDQAGIVTSDDYDYKGNLLRSRRQIARNYKTTLNWVNSPPMEASQYISSTSYDALNRPTEQIAPDGSRIRHSYNEANLLERVEANLRGVATSTVFVDDIDYDAKGQRTQIAYGNGVRTSYEHDPLTMRLTRLQTLRGAEVLQDLRYTYDPVGNITHIRDDAQQTIYFRNQRVEPSGEYTYDAIYRLIEASGREHLGQTGGRRNPPTAPNAFNSFHMHHDQPGNGDAMGTYIERYIYDEVGNFKEMRHSGSDPAHPGWTRGYTCTEPSLLEPSKVSNRLSSTELAGVTERYTYDDHGNMLRMNHLPLMQWDYRDQLQATAQQVRTDGGKPETTWYVYDASGQRVRKVTERQATPGQNPTRKDERIYMGGFESYREYDGDGATLNLERETLHLMDDKQRIALVETRTQGSDGSPVQLLRYQVGNHLGSASLELDNQGQIISYEEYYPYGSTSYQAVRSRTETPKRYRYTGMERDEESGLAYHTARYYASWLGRWTSCDPAGMLDGLNLYLFVGNKPTHFIDPLGLEGTDQVWAHEEPRHDKKPQRSNEGKPQKVALESNEGDHGSNRVGLSGKHNYGPNRISLDNVFISVGLGWRGDHHTGKGGLEIKLMARGYSKTLFFLRRDVDWHGDDPDGFFYEQEASPWGYLLIPSRITAWSSPRIWKAALEVEHSNQENVALIEGLFDAMVVSPSSLAGLGRSPKVSSIPKSPAGPAISRSLRRSALRRAVKAEANSLANTTISPGSAAQTRININYRGTGGSGPWHSVIKHYKGPLGPNRSIFTIDSDALIDILGRKSVIQSPITKLANNNFERIVDVGVEVGISSLNRGGQTTTLLRIITDRLGNLQTVHPW